jgi:Uncharacterized protein conserved in bacteria (DUF2087).
MPCHATSIPLRTPDLSGFARALSKQLATREAPPSHLELLNMLARAAGFRNHQHLRAAHAAQSRLDSLPEVETVDFRQVERALACFDAGARLTRWPARRHLQILCLWALWSRLPAEQALDEPQINRLIDALHLFGDRALIRRDMVGLGLLLRGDDGRGYRRVEQRPPPEARALIRRLAAR